MGGNLYEITANTDPTSIRPRANIELITGVFGMIFIGWGSNSHPNANSGTPRCRHHQTLQRMFALCIRNCQLSIICVKIFIYISLSVFQTVKCKYGDHVDIVYFPKIKIINLTILLILILKILG